MLPIIIGDTRVDRRKGRPLGEVPWPVPLEAGDPGKHPARSPNIRGKYNKQDRLTAVGHPRNEEYLPDENRVRATIEADGGPKIKITTEGAKVSKGNLRKIRSGLR